ncbi:MAG: conserved membrane protein of unknown function [Candidatus Thorarchaeota archaeon]|nr:MAG: conserved membrane protein of unknown function [Candidatus Thorarchaeota archaeon]
MKSVGDSVISDILYPIITIGYIFLIYWAFLLLRKNKQTSLILMIVVMFGLLYDTIVLSIGTLLGTGELLYNLNLGRYIVHALLTPLYIIVAYEQSIRFDINWFGIPKKMLQVIFGVVMMVFIVIALTTHVIGVTLVPTTFDGVLRYIIDPTHGRVPPIAAILTIIVIMIIGFVVMLKTSPRWVWLFIGALVMFIGSAVPSSMFGTLIGSLAEFFLSITLLLTEKKLIEQ